MTHTKKNRLGRFEVVKCTDLSKKKIDNFLADCFDNQDIKDEKNRLLKKINYNRHQCTSGAREDCDADRVELAQYVIIWPNNNDEDEREAEEEEEAKEAEEEKKEQIKFCNSFTGLNDKLNWAHYCTEDVEDRARDLFTDSDEVEDGEIWNALNGYTQAEDLKPEDFATWKDLILRSCGITAQSIREESHDLATSEENKTQDDETQNDLADKINLARMLEDFERDEGGAE